MRSNNRIGEMIVSCGYMTSEECNSVLYKQRSSQKLFGELAVQMKFISEDNLNKILSELYNIDYVDLDFIQIPADASTILPYKSLVEYCAVPFKIDQYIHIAVSDPGNIVITDKIKRDLCRKKVKLYLSSKQKIVRKLSMLIENNITQFDPVILLNDLLCIAVEKHASDLHFEPNDKEVVVRYRIDGILSRIKTINNGIWPKIKSRLKILAGLNIAETRRPQSGHTKIKISEKTIDLRVSTHPCIFGEVVAIRILDLCVGIRSLHSLGFQLDDIKFLSNAIQNPHGIFLISGPTGSGKTTTLYALLQEINKDSINIMTLEDPVEYQIEGIKQLDIKDEGILSFADGIRSLLRQDPDVILVGEVRDEQTASAILRASLTGRLVLATVHAATPQEALQRLINLGADIREFAAQLIGIFSQRLLRRGKAGLYSGRFPVAEYFYSTPDIRERISEADTNIAIQRTFMESIQYAITSDVTDIAEVRRVFGYGYI